LSDRVVVLFSGEIIGIVAAADAAAEAGRERIGLMMMGQRG
jgi:ABC-type uncharacterized transport system ATPase subunit